MGTRTRSIERRLTAAALAVAVVATGTLTAGTSTARGAVEGPSGVVQASGSGAPQLRRDGRWLVDQHGRVVILHGFNLVWKLDPYVPPESAEGFSEADADWLEEHGFNGVRLGTLWAGVTPHAPGAGDATYRDRWQRVMDLLAQRGIWMQLDMHQDQWHETYGGEGVPDWAVHRPAPLGLLGLPPLNAPFPIGYWTPENSRVFDEFWANRHQGLDHWAAAWQIVAGWWKEQPYLMGYDLMNEPWMGLEWSSCLTTGCEASIRTELQPAYEKLTRAIRQVDARNIVWWEPQQLAGGQPVGTYLRPMEGETQLGYSWHNYCPDVFLESQGLPFGDVENCWDYSDGRNTAAKTQAETMGAAPMMSEWGATDNVRAVEIDAAVADRHLMGWTHWAYKQWQDPTTADEAQGMFHDDTDLSSVKQEKLKVLVRTYARATSGEPLAMSFDPGSGEFSYRYRPDAGIPQPTEIFVSPLHYPDGYEVNAVNARWEAAPGNRLLVKPVVPDQDVSVRVVAR